MIARVLSAISTWMLPSVNLRFVWIEVPSDMPNSMSCADSVVVAGGPDG